MAAPAGPVYRQGMSQGRRQHFGNGIYWMRKDRKWSRLDLAKRAELSERYILTIERDLAAPDNARSATLEGLAKAFGLSVDEMIKVAMRPVRQPPTRQQRKTALYQLRRMADFKSSLEAAEAVAAWLLTQPERVRQEALRHKPARPAKR